MADDSGDEAQENESENIAVRPNPLREYVKAEKPEMRAGGEAIELLREILEDLSTDIWDRASEYAENDERETVKERDVRNAYRDIFKSHDMIFQATADLEEMKSDFEEYIIDSALSSRGESDE